MLLSSSPGRYRCSRLAKIQEVKVDQYEYLSINHDDAKIGGPFRSSTATFYSEITSGARSTTSQNPPFTCGVFRLRHYVTESLLLEKIVMNDVLILLKLFPFYKQLIFSVYASSSAPQAMSKMFLGNSTFTHGSHSSETLFV